MYLGSTAVCCDEAMKLVTCLGILAFTYLCQKRKEGDGGEYSQLNMSETNGTRSDFSKADGADEEDFDDSNSGGESDGDTNITEAKNHESFRSYLSEQLQFDFRLAGIAGLYTVQKNLLYLGISNLDAAVFQGE